MSPVFIENFKALPAEEKITELRKLSEKQIKVLTQDEDICNSGDLYKMMGLVAETNFNDVYNTLGINDDDDVYENQDHHCFCVVGDYLGELLYLAMQLRSCCGNSDNEVEFNGKKFKIGFSYGH